MLNWKNNKRIKYEDDVSIKAKHFQEEANMQSKLKRGGGMQQKIPSKLSYHDRCFSSIANCFICSSSYSRLNTFRDESFLQIMSTIAGDNEFN